MSDFTHLGDAKMHKDAFLKIYDGVADGRLVSPRGQLVREVENFVYVLPPYVRFANFESRKLKVEYVKKEFLWYLAGDRHDASIAEHAQIWKQVMNEDGSFNSNYGQYIFRGESNQFDNVIKILKADKDSRRASMTILNDNHLLSNTNDVPCTYALNFRIRKNILNMTVHMRSQDSIFGMGSDAPIFSFIHEMMLNELREVYSGLGYGEYCHFADSFHIYKRHFSMLHEIIWNDEYELVLCPKISSAAEVGFIRKLDFSSIPDEYEFAKWLQPTT